MTEEGDEKEEVEEAEEAEEEEWKKEEKEKKRGDQEIGGGLQPPPPPLLVMVCREGGMILIHGCIRRISDLWTLRYIVLKYRNMWTLTLKILVALQKYHTVLVYRHLLSREL